MRPGALRTLVRRDRKGGIRFDSGLASESAVPGAVLNQAEPQGAPAAKACKLLLQVLGLSPDRTVSVSVGRYFSYSPHGYHPYNFQAARAFWRALRGTTFLGDGPVGHDHEVVPDLAGDLVLFGGPNSTVLTSAAFEFTGTGTRRQRPEDREEQPILGFPFYGVSDEQYVTEEVLLETTPGRVAALNWPVRGTALAKPKWRGLHPPPISQERLVMAGQRSVVNLLSDYMIVTRMPNFVSPQLELMLRSHKPAEWPQLIVVDGMHGVGTRAFELLIRKEHLEVLKTVQQQTAGATAFQALFRVGDLEVDGEGFRQANSIELLDIEELHHTPDEYRRAHQYVSKALALWEQQEHGEDARAVSSLTEWADWAETPPPTVNDSSSGMWNQLVVPDFLLEEERAMKKPAIALGEASAEDVVRQFNTLNERVTTAQKPFREQLQTILDGLAGRSFGSLEANQQVANELQFLMLRLDVRLRCPQKGCREASMIRCKRAGRAKHGSFVFEHAIDGKRTIHSALTKLPKLRLVPAPPDPRRKRRSKVRR